MFVADGGECLTALSYSKIMGLYGERVGALSIVMHSDTPHFIKVTCMCLEIQLHVISL